MKTGILPFNHGSFFPPLWESTIIPDRQTVHQTRGKPAAATADYNGNSDDDDEEDVTRMQIRPGNQSTNANQLAGTRRTCGMYVQYPPRGTATAVFIPSSGRKVYWPFLVFGE